MTADDYYSVFRPSPLPPGVTPVYRAGKPGRERSMFHTDWRCPRLAPTWRVVERALADAVNYRLGDPCPYCVADAEVLREVVLEHDEHGRPVAVQTGLEGVG